MDEKSFSNHADASIDEKFGLGKKWFWIGVVISLFSGVAGLIFGVALITEKKYRREGWIITIIGGLVTIANIFQLAKLYYY